jgi:hypothetical protein
MQGSKSLCGIVTTCYRALLDAASMAFALFDSSARESPAIPRERTSSEQKNTLTSSTHCRFWKHDDGHARDQWDYALLGIFEPPGDRHSRIY